MVNAPKENILPLPRDKYGKSTQHTTRQSHQANDGKICFEAERVWALGALRSLQSRKKLAAEKWKGIHYPGNKEQEIWIEDNVEIQSPVAWKRVEDTEPAIQQEQEDIRNVENAGMTTREPKNNV